MTTDARERLKAQLIVDEGVKSFAYRDSLGYWTIGVGRLIDGRKGGGLSYAESLFLLENDIDDKIRDLVRVFPWVLRLDEVRQSVLVQLTFNLGIKGLSQFVNTMRAVERDDWEAAADGLRNSLWFRQVQKSRSTRLIEMMRTGRWPDEAKA